MTPSHLADPSHIPTGSNKAITLALSLAQAEKAIHDFTAGQVDAILDSDGKAYLLRPAQECLRQDERQLQSVLDSIADAIIVADQSGVILYHSRSTKRVLGYEAGEMLGRCIFDFIHDEELSAAHFAFFGVIELFRESATVQFRQRANDDSYRPVEATIAQIRDSSIRCVVFSLRPIDRIQWKRQEPAMPGTREVPATLEELDGISLSHGRRIPLTGVPSNSGPATT